MTRDELNAIKDRMMKATVGPWAWEQYGEKVNGYHIGIAMDKNDNQCEGHVDTERYDEDQDVFIEDILWKENVGNVEDSTLNYSDADFIAHAREDIPKLVAEIERLLSI